MKIFSKQEIKTLWPFYAQSLAENTSKVIMPFYILFFLSIGLNFFQIAIIGTVRSVVALLFEVPTGAIADIYGRKFSVIAGYLLMGITTIAVIFTRDYYFLLIIFGFNALFETLVSGADSAWAVDLSDSKERGLSDTYFLKKRTFRNVGMVIAPLAAGIIVSSYGMTSLWLVYGLGILLSALFLFCAEKVEPISSDDKDDLEIIAYKNVFTHANKTWHFIRNHKILSLVFFAGFIFFFVEEITTLAWTPYLQNSGLSLPTIGYLFSIIAGLGIITPLVVEKILKYKSKFTLLITTTLIYAVSLILAAMMNKAIFIVILFVVVYNLEEIIEPIEEALTNKYIESKTRATALSLKSVFVSLASILGGPLAGYLLGIVTLGGALLISGLIFLIIPIIYTVASKRSVETA